MTEDTLPPNPPHDDNEPKPDLSEIFDLNRHKAVADFTDRFQELERQKEVVNNDIRQLKDDAAEAMFSPVEIKAMAQIAKWRQKDQNNAAAEQLAALRRVSNAVKLDLFSWADKHREDQ